ncbi:hypothetical protein BVRB_4g076040 [Beta vulgaris subsp. vulgaris]|uniref:Leucine-rich repeat-containing N-terminal plant-type domain-containing protein n=1 Tax=Beta vulgaris subsp. vulgaris TaxID=3555 RepID=A0A0J8CQE9_BETVV|nr:hypothetical protein BVRB_4g076040 [Beta vulgaris subsp. vulgaris]
MEGHQQMIFIFYHCCILFFSSVNQLAHSSPTSNSCNPDDKNVLLQIKDHFHNVYPFSEWNPKSDDCCNYEGVDCHDQGPGLGRINSIFITQASGVGSLAGEIPSIIGDLPFLTTIGFSGQPNLTGSIPPSFTKLTMLAVLDLESNSLSGPIPDFLGQIKTLRVIQIGSNQFSGSIPSSLSLLPILSILDLSGNRLTGAIPESFGSFTTGLKTLRLQGNNGLSGAIPKSLGKPNLTTLDLSYNKFTGDASFLFSKDKPLVILELRQNQLKFNFSKVDLPMSLNYFDIAYNNIYGSLPKRAGQLHQWIYFNVSFNELCGKIPKGGRLKQFSPSGFSHNKCLCDAPGLPPCK